jgi:predicted metal-dependent phosphoesterase TrpH
VGKEISLVIIHTFNNTFSVYSSLRKRRKNLKKLLFHIHTEKSFDSNLKIYELLDFVVKNKIDYFCVSDHHTFKGCEEIEKLLHDKKYKGKTSLIKGVEITTEYGDVIPCFIKKEIKTKKFLEVVKQTKDQNGLLIIPHPFVRHKKIGYLLKYADGIEIWNSASSLGKNRKALRLGRKNPHLLKISAVDAHSPKELKNALNRINIGNKIEISPILLRSGRHPIPKLRHGKNVLRNLFKKMIGR